MANQYRFLPDFSVFENDEQNDVSTEDTSSSIMSRNRQVDTDASGTGGDFLERFYQNLRDSFKDDDKFKQTFMSKNRPKPDISELRSYVDKVKGSSGIEDALLEATGMYNPGMPSDDNSMTIKDASDGITIPKQPDVMVDELSSSLGSYLRNRANKGSSFVGEGVQMASAGSLSVEDMDLARMMAGQTMRKEAAEMGLPVVDMEEEAKKSAVEAARERAKKGITQSKGAPQGIMSPVTSDPRVDMAATGLNEDDPLGRVRPKARPEVATAEVETLTDDDMGLTDIPTFGVGSRKFNSSVVDEMVSLEGMGGDDLSATPTYSYGITKEKADKYNLVPESFNTTREFADAFADKYIEEKYNANKSIFDNVDSEFHKPLMSYLWNVGSFGTNQRKALSKKNPDVREFIKEMRDAVHSEGFASSGLSARRAKEANLLGEGLANWEDIVKVEVSGTKEKPVFKWLTASGDVVEEFASNKKLHPNNKLSDVAL
jgi:hypothetical protein